MSKISKFLKSPYYAVGNYIFNRCPNILSDKYFLKVLYKRCFGTKLNLKNPQTFNEKLQWLKLNDRNSLYPIIVDKYSAKEYFASIIGNEYIIPTLAKYDSVDEIDISKLPEKFVLKCNHDSGSTILCPDKSLFDVNDAKRKLADSLSRNYYWNSREWPYKKITPCIIAEPYLKDDAQESLVDYKLMCFNGEVKCSFVCTNRRSANGLNVTFFDREWNRLPFERLYKADSKPIKKPATYDKMLSISEELTKDIVFARVDFYEISGRLYLGEITLYPGGGFEPFFPQSWDYLLGDMIHLH